MKKINNIGKFAAICLIASLAVGCGKKWKKPTSVDISFAAPSVTIGSGAPEEGEFWITGGHVKLNAFDVFGIRKQSNDIDFSDASSQTFELDGSSETAMYNFDIPQGTYTDLRFLLSTESDGNDPGIFVKGKYTNDDGETATVLFKYRVNDIVSVRAKDADGSGEIVLVAGNGRKMVLNIDVNYWFASVTHEMWQNADYQGNSGNSAIHIEDGGDNSNIYEAITNRLHDGFFAQFE